MLLSPNDVQEIGLGIMNVHVGKKKEKRLNLEFHRHFGSSALDVAEIWCDLCYYDKKVIPKKEQSMKGFKMHLAVHYWLWA